MTAQEHRDLLEHFLLDLSRHKIVLTDMTKVSKIAIDREQMWTYRMSLDGWGRIDQAVGDFIAREYPGSTTHRSAAYIRFMLKNITDTIAKDEADVAHGAPPSVYTRGILEKHRDEVQAELDALQQEAN